MWLLTMRFEILTLVFSKRSALLLSLLLVFITGRAAQADNSNYWEAISDKHGISVAVYPREGGIPLNRFHHWVVSLKDRTGKFVDTAKLQLHAGMPEHGHGMPSAPQMTRYLENGQYLIEGMQFNMKGDWEFRIFFQTPELSDSATFNIVLEY